MSGQSFILRARLLKQAIQSGHREPRWAQLSDGDLWHDYWHAICAKGPNSVALSKVKGHATIQDIQSGITTPMDKHGNDVADSLATQAREARDDNLSGISDYFAGRQSQYVDFVFSLHSYILHMAKAIFDAREQHAKRERALGLQSDKVSINNSLPYARLDCAVYPDLIMLPRDTFTHLASGTHMIIGFLSGWTWAMAPANTPGCTWLELCILFFLHGGSCVDLDLCRRKTRRQCWTIHV